MATPQSYRKVTSHENSDKLLFYILFGFLQSTSNCLRSLFWRDGLAQQAGRHNHHIWGCSVWTRLASPGLQRKGKRPASANEQQPGAEIRWHRDRPWVLARHTWACHGLSMPQITEVSGDGMELIIN